MPDCIKRFLAEKARDEHLAQALSYQVDADDLRNDGPTRSYCRRRVSHFLDLAAADEKEMLSYAK